MYNLCICFFCIERKLKRIYNLGEETNPNNMLMLEITINFTQGERAIIATFSDEEKEIFVSNAFENIYEKVKKVNNGAWEGHYIPCNVFIPRYMLPATQTPVQNDVRLGMYFNTKEKLDALEKETFMPILYEYIFEKVMEVMLDKNKRTEYFIRGYEPEAQPEYEEEEPEEE